MAKRIVVGLVVVVLLAIGGLYVTGQFSPAAALEASGANDAAGEPILAPREIISEAQVVPARQADLAVAASGQVAEVLVAPGDLVDAGEALLRLDSQAQEIALDEARLSAEIAAAQVAKLDSQPRAEDVAAMDAAVRVALANVSSAEAAVQSAEAGLRLAQRGPTVEDVAIAERRIELAKNALWSVQSQRDAICGRVGRGAQQADCDAAQAGVYRAEEELRIVELQMKQVQAGPSAEQVAVAQSAVQQAEGQLATAQAQADKAQVESDRAARPATAEDLMVARAQLEQSQAAVRRAELGLEQTTLRAPFAGSVVQVNVEQGELTGAEPQVSLADLSAWQIETVDLNELNVVDIEVGDLALLTLDSLPDQVFSGRVSRIEALGQTRMGEITYRMVVLPDDLPAEVRWNMTAVVNITPNQ